MADTQREIERKYESDTGTLPDLTRVTGVASVIHQGVSHLDATYHDTTVARLAASGRLDETVVDAFSPTPRLRSYAAMVAEVLTSRGAGPWTS